MVVGWQPGRTATFGADGDSGAVVMTTPVGVWVDLLANRMNRRMEILWLTGCMYFITLFDHTTKDLEAAIQRDLAIF